MTRTCRPPIAWSPHDFGGLRNEHATAMQRPCFLKSRVARPFKVIRWMTRHPAVLYNITIYNLFVGKVQTSSKWYLDPCVAEASKVSFAASMLYTDAIRFREITYFIRPNMFGWAITFQTQLGREGWWLWWHNRIVGVYDSVKLLIFPRGWPVLLCSWWTPVPSCPQVAASAGRICTSRNAWVVATSERLSEKPTHCVVAPENKLPVATPKSSCISVALFSRWNCNLGSCRAFGQPPRHVWSPSCVGWC